MAYDFHKDRKAYFDQQTVNATHYVLPFIEQKMKLGAGTTVLEIGCAEGGVSKAFYRKGCTTVGVELSAYRVDHAVQFLEEEISTGGIQIICSDIFDVDFAGKFHEYFDLIVMKDVIEHIHGQAELLENLKQFLAPSGKIFFGFPPWQMPFGGHQQIAQSKFLARLPFFHLLPTPLYRGILKAFKQHPTTIEELLEIKETGISLEKFERIVHQKGYKIINKQLYAINPIYKYKFGLKPRKQIPVLGSIPYLRNFINTAAFYLIEK
ncbi:MAG TPA: class I SAM-dependent methyltransferase [Saprospiraceae bacterium]|nr:class I SAM-dependent methyltransferase [Saprospiraceae bacterium]